MLNNRWRQRPLAVLATGLALVVSGCDSGPESETEPAPKKAEQKTASPEPESDQVSIPPELESGTGAQPMPAFHEIPAGPQRKEAFFSYLAPIVSDINQEVAKRRDALLALEQQLEAGKPLDQDARDWLARMAERYRVDADGPEKRIAALKARIDIIPVSLALAQGALESAWGTSRFARQGNNIFGKWCFTRGCGIVPKRRRADATHEVARYDDVADAVRDYIHHLNSHPVYEPLRERRARARREGRSPSGTDLAAGLEKYSAKGKGYVTLVRQMINGNDLADASDDPKDA